MVKINLIPVTELFDELLSAEYREMNVISANLKRSINCRKIFDIKDIP